MPTSKPSGHNNLAPEKAAERAAADAASTGAKKVPVSEPEPSDRVSRIKKAAYRRAEARGFAPGAELEDWLMAEREVDGEGERK